MTVGSQDRFPQGNFSAQNWTSRRLNDALLSYRRLLHQEVALVRAAVKVPLYQLFNGPVCITQVPFRESPSCHSLTRSPPKSWAVYRRRPSDCPVRYTPTRKVFPRSNFCFVVKRSN